MATLRSESSSAPPAEIAPLFSTSSTPPLRSRIAVAVPSLPDTAALIVPLLRTVSTSAPSSITTAVAIESSVLPLLALIVPELRISGTVASAPMRSAVALASTDLAAIVPEFAMPPAMLTAPPRPPITRPLPSTPA